MANHKNDIAGQRFGKLTAVQPDHAVSGRWKWLFKCDCGGECVRFSYVMVRERGKGTQSSCGCEQHLRTHGLSSQFKKLNWVWGAMRQRCFNPSNKDYPNYGGRGITICEEWSDFAKFKEWAVTTGYREGLTIERVDVNGHYEPDNCTWLVNERQALNTRIIRKFEYHGKQYTIRELSELSGIPLRTLKGRLTNYGWSVERAVNEPAFKGKNQNYKG